MPHPIQSTESHRLIFGSNTSEVEVFFFLPMQVSSGRLIKYERNEIREDRYGSLADIDPQ